MVNAMPGNAGGWQRDDGESPERGLILAYAPTIDAANALAALLALDDRLGETLRTTSEPMLGQIRLKWWEDALEALDRAPAPAEPVLQGIAAAVVRPDVTGGAVAGIVAGWSVLLDPELDAEALRAHGERGARLFTLAGRIAGAAERDPVAVAGQGWALADLALKLSDPGEAAAARAVAEVALDQACSARWSRNGRALGAMAHLARLDLAGVERGSPRRMLRALWHRMSGR
uniref:hypothetical protein n=1 Tax=Sphingomonas sp. BE123 TaxID=2817842 RepID=UPI00286D4C10|nr:hypothetical protein [Sphingomonas sp. BE123]